MFQIVNHHKKLQTLRSPPGPLCSLILVTLSTLCLELFSVCSQLSKCFLCVWSKWLPKNRKSSCFLHLSQAFPLSFYSKGTLTLHWAPCFPWSLLTALGTLGLEGEDLWFWLLTGPSQLSCSSPTKNPGFKTCQCTRDCFPSFCHHLWKFSHASSFLSERTSWIIAFHFRTSRTFLLDNQMYKFWSSFQWPHLSSSDISV